MQFKIQLHPNVCVSEGVCSQWNQTSYSVPTGVAHFYAAKSGGKCIYFLCLISLSHLKWRMKVFKSHKLTQWLVSVVRYNSLLCHFRYALKKKQTVEMNCWLFCFITSCFSELSVVLLYKCDIFWYKCKTRFWLQWRWSYIPLKYFNFYYFVISKSLCAGCTFKNMFHCVYNSSCLWQFK